MFSKIKMFKNKDVKNIYYSLVSYCINPVILIITTPLLLKNLGPENYGLWILINSVINILGISNFGLGNAMIKLGAGLVNENTKKFSELFRATFTVSLILSILFFCLMCLFGINLIDLLINELNNNSIQNITILISLVVSIRIVNGIISGSFMAKERYDVNSKINIVYNSVSSIVFTVLAIMYGDILILVISLVFLSIVLLGSNMIISKKISKEISFKLLYDKELMKSIINYGFYSWIQLIITNLTTQVDKLIISLVLGNAALGYYTVCMQLIQKIQEVPAAASGFMFAKFSNVNEQMGIKGVKTLYYNSVKLVSVFALFCSVFLFIFSAPILRIWISPEFAIEYTGLFRALIVPMFFSALYVIPTYFLNGTGYIKHNTFFSLCISFSSLFSYLVFLPIFGLIGSAMSRSISIPFIILSLLYIQYKVLSSNKKHNTQVNVRVIEENN